MTGGRMQDAVLRLLRGEPLEIVARELAVMAADLSGWRDAFLEAGAARLKSRARDDRDETLDRLRTKVGELSMETELLYAKIERLEAEPLSRRGGRSDERCHLDLPAPSLRCRPGLGFCSGGGYRSRRAAVGPLVPRRRLGPEGAMPDAALLEAIRRVLMDSPFHGDGVKRSSGASRGRPARRTQGPGAAPSCGPARL